MGTLRPIGGAGAAQVRGDGQRLHPAVLFEVRQVWRPLADGGYAMVKRG